MHQYKSRVSRKVTVAIVMLVVFPLLSVAVLRAQGRSPIDAIDEKLDTVLGALDTVLNPAARSVTLSTSLAVVSQQVGDLQFARCTAANVSASPVQVTIAAIDFLGRVVDANEVELAPGEGTIGASSSFPDTLTLIRCRFRFVGRPADLRASMLVVERTQVGIEDSPKTVASIPAE